MKKALCILLIINIVMLFVGCTNNNHQIEPTEIMLSDSSDLAPTDPIPTETITSYHNETIATEEANREKIDIASGVFKHVSPFHEGLAWIKDNDGYLKVVDREGYVVYKASQKASYSDYSERIEKIYPFCGGLAYYKISDDPCIVIDNEGNEIYTEVKTDDIEERILGVGAGRIFIRRSIHTFDENVVKFGALDKDGNDVGEFIETAYDTTDVINCGEGFFMYGSYSSIPDDSRVYTYDIATNTETKVSCALPSQNYMGTKFWYDNWDSAYCLYNLNTDQIEAEISYNPEDMYSSSKAIFDDQAVINGTYYDMNGNIIGSITIDKEYEPYFLPISTDGYTPVVLTGKDNQKHFTFYNKDGVRQFDPIRIKISDNSHFLAGHDYIAILDDSGDNFLIYHHDGTISQTIPVRKHITEYDSEAFDDYIIGSQHAYYFL